MTDHCPACDSPQPHLHPAVQHGGEVQICSDPWHRQQDHEKRGQIVTAEDFVNAFNQSKT